jgi:tRNA 2-thiocytidine biosynthesis protein TtcA
MATERDIRLRRTLRFYLRKVNRAVSMYHMIAEGDRIAVAVSGGKDSLSLLRLLRERPNYFPPSYDIVALHVSYIGWDVGAPPPEVLEEHFRREGVPYRIETVDFRNETPGCFRCSWVRRKALFIAAHELGCNKLALAHHLEDIVETTLMNLLLHGRLERPEPCYPLFGGALTLIRPLTFLQSHELRRFARLFDLPVYESNCPFSRIGVRGQLRAFLSELRRTCPELYINVFRSVERYRPLQEQRERAKREQEDVHIAEESIWSTGSSDRACSSTLKCSGPT